MAPPQNNPWSSSPAKDSSATTERRCATTSLRRSSIGTTLSRANSPSMTFAPSSGTSSSPMAGLRFIPTPNPITQLEEKLATARNEYRGAPLRLLRPPAPASTGSPMLLPAFPKVRYHLGWPVTLNFEWFDEQGTAVSDDEVKLPNDMSLDYVRGQAMQLCDCYEIQMVNKLNRSIIAHWGRNRLLALARGPWTEHAASCKEEKLNLLLCPRLSRWVVQESTSDHKFLINQGIVIGDMYTELSNSELYPPDDQPYERGEIDLDLVLIPGLVGALNLLKPLSETEHPNLGGHWY